MYGRSYDELCGLATNAAATIQGKWRIPILCALQGGPVRLGQLVRLIPTASKKVLAKIFVNWNVMGSPVDCLDPPTGPRILPISVECLWTCMLR